MGQLNNLYVSSSFQGLLKMTDSTSGLTSTLQTIQAGDGSNSPLQMSLTEVNISGSFLINNVPITNGTSGSSGTSGSNGTDGTSGTSGTDGTSGSNGSDGTSGTSGSNGTDGSSGTSGSNGSDGTSGTSGSSGTDGSSGTSGSNGTDGTSGDSLFAQTGSYWATTNDLQVTGSLGITNIYGTGSLFLQPNQADARFVEIYNTSPTDTHITASGGQIFLGDDVTYVKVDNYGSVERIDIVAGNELVVSSSVINLSGSLHQSGTFYPDQIDFINSSIQLGTGSYVLTTNTSGVTQYDTYANIATALSPYISSNRDGLITTGSITDTQQITGSLILDNTILSGSLIGGVVNGGLIKIQTESNISGSVQFNITGSNPISQSNLIFGVPAGGPAVASQTGSVIISGSNNIVFNGFRTNTLGQGLLGYIGGNNNIISTIPTISTSSFLNQNIFFSSNNTHNSPFTIDAPATGAIVDPNYFNQVNSNFLNSAVTLRHKSGSFSFNNNSSQGVFNSFATQSLLFPSGAVSGPTISGNVHAGSATVLSHISSSILYTNNISDSSNLLIRNSATHPAALNNSGSVTVGNNIFGGATTTLTFSGTGPQNTKGVSNNIVIGTNNELNIISSGSSAFISNTAIVGQALIVSGTATGIGGGGSTFVGRFNATGSLQESTNETVFVVGTGPSAGARRNALRIDSNNNSNFTGSVNISGSLSVNGVAVTSDRNGLITTGSVGSTQSITGSLNMANGSINVLGSFSNLNIQSGSINLNNDGQSSISNQGTGRNVMYVDNQYSNFFFGNVPKGQSGRFSGDTNNFVLSPTYSDFQSGSRNLIFAIGNSFFQSGSNNIFIGDGQPFGNSVSESFYIGHSQANNTSIITKRGGGTSSPIQLGYSTQVTGSLNVSNGATITGSLLTTTGITIDNQLSISNGRNSKVNNIAIGSGSLVSNTTGENNISIGVNGLEDLTTGAGNTSINSSLQSLTNGFRNIGIGGNSAYNLITGNDNIAIGKDALSAVYSGSTNLGIGNGAGGDGTGGVLDGGIYLGYRAGNFTTGSNLLVIDNQSRGGNDAVVTGSLIVGTFDANPSNQTLRINASTTISGSLSVGGNLQFNVGSFSSTQNQSGSANVSQSITYDTTDYSQGVSYVSGSQLTVANSGVYNIQFSAQLLADTGADDVYIWLKKNGTNVSNTAGKVTLANNEELMATWNYIVDSAAGDYYELVWQSTNGDAIILAETASGNIPALPSIITTVTQVR
jgi:hypothetical protein